MMNPAKQMTMNQQLLSITIIVASPEPRGARKPGCGWGCDSRQAYIPGVITPWCNRSPSVQAASGMEMSAASTAKASFAMRDRMLSQAFYNTALLVRATLHRNGSNARLQTETPPGRGSSSLSMLRCQTENQDLGILT